MFQCVPWTNKMLYYFKEVQPKSRAPGESWESGIWAPSVEETVLPKLMVHDG